MGNTYFDVLRLPRNANDVQIGDAYRQLRAAYANDSGRLRKVEDAYRVLANPISRRSYLQALDEGRAPDIDAEPVAGDQPLDQPPDGAEKPATPFTLFRRGAGAASVKRNKTELLDPAHAETSNPLNAPPAPAIPRQGRRNRNPTELIETNPASAPASSPAKPEPGAASRPSAAEPAANAWSDKRNERNERNENDHSDRVERDVTHEVSTGASAGRDANRDAARISSAKRPVSIALVEVAYDGHIEVFELPNGTNWIGRPSKEDPPPAVPLPDPDRFVSRKHARIFLDGSTWTVTDNSENGTLLNGKTMRKGQPNRLKDGDVLTIEGRTLTVRRAGDG